MYLGFESLTLRQKEECSESYALSFLLGIRTRREQAQLAEENSPADCFRRRGNERSEAIGAAAPEKSLTLRQKEECSESYALSF